MRLDYLTYSLGLIMMYIGAIVCCPIIIALIFQDYSSIIPFFVTGIISASIGILLKYVINKKNNFKNLNDIKKSEGLFIVAISWIVSSFIATIPYLFYGITPINAFFESVSGITTTGATILTHYNYPLTLMFWRSFTQWIGGMGIVVLFIAVLPQFAVAGRQMFFAENPGPTEDKFTPRIRSTATLLWIIYVGLTLLEILCLIISGMPVFDSICNSLSTISAGGFSPNANSIMGYHSNYITWIIMIFIFLAGSSFNLQHKAYSKYNPLLMWKNEEFRVYLSIFVTISILVTSSLIVNDNYAFFNAITDGFYQTISIMTSTGSVSFDYVNWSFYTQLLLILATLTGGCAGSVAGGIKIARWILLYKIMKVELKKILHPSAVINIKMNNRIVQKDVLNQTVVFILFYIAILLVSIFLITLIEGNLVIGISSSVSSLGNIGPGFGNIIGPFGNYNSLHAISKFILAFNMIIGRLELIPILVFLEHDFYRFKV